METTKTPNVRAEEIDPAIENANSEECNLSILMNADGLVFSILRNDVPKFIVLGDYQRKKDAVDIASLFNFKSQLQGDFANYSIGYSTPKFAVVPQTLFDSSKLKEYASFQFELNEDEELYYDELSTHGIVVVFSIPNDVKEHLENNFHGVSFNHSASFGISYYLNLYKNIPGQHIHANCWAGNVELIAINNGKLLLSTVFSYETNEDLLYYILNVFEQLEMNPETVPLKISGELEKHFESWRLLEKYIRFVEVEDRPANYQYSHEFKNLPEHRYNRVFQAATCVL